VSHVLDVAYNDVREGLDVLVRMYRLLRSGHDPVGLFERAAPRVELTSQAPSRRPITLEPRLGLAGLAYLQPGRSKGGLLRSPDQIWRFQEPFTLL
jgi:hypothetical protein